MEDAKYLPGVFDRIKAVFIDTVLLVLISYILALLFENLEVTSQTIRILVFVVIFVLYDPVFTSQLGGTIGHTMIGIAVRNTETNRNISFFNALLRFIFKSLLGWISLLTVGNSEKKQAIHDKIAKSWVIYTT